MGERSFGFRQRLNQIHRPGRRDPALCAAPFEVAVDDHWRIAIDPDASAYMVRVAQDLQDYLFTSMGVAVPLARDDRRSPGPAGATIRLGVQTQSAGTVRPTPRSYQLQVAPGWVAVWGADERGTAQGSYYLEDLMNLRQAPFLARQEGVREPLFAPRMVHSGWGIDQFPDPHLAAIAHAGMDAILLFVKGPDQTTTGYLDINDLIDRAGGLGVDVYFYSYLVSRMHPSEPEARAYYESTYGALMAAHPRARGIVFVGESCEFPSRDPRTTGRLRLDPAPDGKPDPRPSPGWWPCTDYPAWLDLIKSVVRAHNPAADIVFWTYNWGWAPEADRLALIAALPTDVSLQATFEMFEDIPRDGIGTRCVDYTVSFAGPGRYFRSEAQAAAERGMPLYAMSNTGGLTWDIGVIPYEPVPFQWATRHQALLRARHDWGLVGLMESHHYGWWPSFVSDLAKAAFWSPSPSPEAVIEALAGRDFGPQGGPLAVAAWRHWSDAIRDYVPTNEDQYGPFRIGPAFPLRLDEEPEPIPAAAYAHFGNQIVTTRYQPHQPADVPTEINLLQRLRQRWQQGLDLLRQAAAAAAPRQQPEAERMVWLGQFVAHCVTTAIHTKQWWLLCQALRAAPDLTGAEVVAARMRILGAAEMANAEAAIPLVEADSRLGWEPSMEYMADRAHLEWKIAQLQRVLEHELPARVADAGSRAWA